MRPVALLLLAACAARPVSPALPAPVATAEAPRELGACIVLHPESAEPAHVEGTLAAAAPGATLPFTLRLTRPRCVVGLPHASFVTDVQIASTGADLRSLVGRALRIRGDAVAGESDLGGPAVIVLARDFERLPPEPTDP